MVLELRKIVTYAEDTGIEGGKGRAPAAAALRGRRRAAQPLGGTRLRRSPTPALRQSLPPGAVGAKSYLAFTNTRGGPAAPIVIPLMDKHDEGRRYPTVPFSIDDAPAPDEVVVALGASVGGRPHHRIGDRYKDLEELGGTHG